MKRIDVAFEGALDYIEDYLSSNGRIEDNIYAEDVLHSINSEILRANKAGLGPWKEYRTVPYLVIAFIIYNIKFVYFDPDDNTYQIHFREKALFAGDKKEMKRIIRRIGGVSRDVDKVVNTLKSWS